MGTRMVHEFHGVEDNYRYISLVLWEFAPVEGYKQMVALVVAWVHGCIGIHFWLRLKPAYRRAMALVYAGAVLVPVLSLLGFIAGGREAAALARDPAWLERTLAEIRLPDDAVIAQLGALHDNLVGGFIAALALTLLARIVRAWWERRRGLVRITYPDGRVVEVTGEATILEAQPGRPASRTRRCAADGAGARPAGSASAAAPSRCPRPRRPRRGC